MDWYSFTPKQEEIIYLIYRFRFLNRVQIQTMLNHKDYRRINAWLKELTDTNFLGRIYLKKLFENTKPAIYYLSGKSLVFMYEKHKIPKERLKKYYDDKNRSQRFINHCTFLADMYLYLLSKQENKEALHFFTKAVLSDCIYFPQPLPDAYIAVKDRKETSRYFLEVFDEGVPRYALRGRIKQYFRYAEEGDWEANIDDSPFPNILLVCPNEMTKKFLNRFIQQYIEESYTEINFYLATRNKIDEKKDNIWSKVQ